MRNEDNNTDRKRDNEGRYISDSDRNSSRGGARSEVHGEVHGEAHGAQQGSTGRADQSDRKRDENGQFVAEDNHTPLGNKNMSSNKRSTGL